MPVPDDVRRGPDGRYQRYVGHGEYERLPDKSEAHRRRADLIGNVLLMGVPLGGVAQRGHWLLKGARPVVANGRRYASITRTSGLSYRYIRPGFIPKRVYQRRWGLPRYSREAAKLPDRVKTSMIRKAQKDFPRTSAVISRTQFLLNPVKFLKKRYIPVPLLWGYQQKDRFDSLWNTLVIGDRPNTGESGQVTKPHREFDGAGEPLPPRVLPSISPQRLRKSKSQGRCPPGHRWSSKLKKCVRSRRRR